MDSTQFHRCVDIFCPTPLVDNRRPARECIPWLNVWFAGSSLNYGTMIIRTVSVTAARFDEEPAITTIGSPDLAKPVSFSCVTA